MKRQKLAGATLGIITSIGGYLEVGSTGTALQAGSTFRLQLLWALVLGTICIAFLTEMSGRLAAVSKHTLAAAIRERFGINFDLVPLLAQLAVDLLVLASEIGGISLALQLLTGIAFHWWAIPAGLAVWLLLWRGTFGVIQNGVSLLGLVTLSFVLGAILMHPAWTRVVASFVPSWPDREPARYGFMAVSIIGATVSPYLVTFYSSGAVEDRWDESHVPINRVVAAVGMAFGSVVSAGVFILAAQIFQPAGILVSKYIQAAPLLTPVFGSWGFFLFALSLLIGCFGAALQVALDGSYITAQAFGWNWSENLRPKDDSRFCFVYTAMIPLAVVPTLLGVEPLKLTMFTMAITVLVLPLVVVPLLVIMNDREYLREYRNGWITNAAVIAVIVLSFVLAIVAIPLQVLGG
jgi:Mn2+/Fe2+ NRAMP family transporter